MARLTLDASVVIAYLDEQDALHERAAASVMRASGDELVIPASAYAEVLVGAFRVDPRRVTVFDDLLASVPIRIEPITAEIARRAARLRASHGPLKIPDALVLATADALDATLVTGDQRLRRHAHVRVI